MNEYIKLFIDDDYPEFIDKYLTTDTLERLKHITQFCGCDYTKLYSILFKYTRFDHSLVVAHMTWHFTHDKKETIMALLHDIGTPCFAHCIDYVFGDYLNQESSERSITDIIKKDKKMQEFLKKDNLCAEDFINDQNFPILENKSPKLCADRLDGVLHTCYIWLHTHSLKQIKEVYDNIVVLENEENKKEIGFQNEKVAMQFVCMVKNYAIALQKNEDKFTMQFIASIIKEAVEKNLITIEDLYKKKESDIIGILEQNFSVWKIFNETDTLVKTNEKPNQFYVSVNSKKRNVIPLIKTKKENKRITEVSKEAKEIQEYIKEFQDTKYAYVEEIKEIEQ